MDAVRIVAFCPNRDLINYELRNQLRITNYELRHIPKKHNSILYKLHTARKNDARLRRRANERRRTTSPESLPAAGKEKGVFQFVAFCLNCDFYDFYDSAAARFMFA
jgi:hypothetical protein